MCVPGRTPIATAIPSLTQNLGEVMKIAYGTYATPAISLEEVIPILADTGYDGIEICHGPKHVGSMPNEITPERRQRIKELLAEHHLGVPALFPLGHIFAKDDAEHQSTVAWIRDCARLAQDLELPSPPVIAIGIGGKTDEYVDIRDTVVQQLQDYAKLAEEEDFVLAGEAHVNAAFDRSERIAWLFDSVGHPRIRFHFDIVHLFLANETIEDAVRTLLPYTAHTHVTDAEKLPDGKFDLKLPGTGDLDLVAYVRAMHECGWDDYITLEISTRVWSEPDFDQVEAAKSCYATLDGAFREAGVPRG